MAERRMFAKTIIDSDAFLDLPVMSQLLYFHLSMRGDDDGFINKPKTIMRMIGAKDDDMMSLINRKFIIPFESGVVVIKHWRIHNYIRKDMYHQTKYIDEKNTLEFDENNAYRANVTNTLQVRDEHVTNPSTQVRLGKDSLGKDNTKRFTPPSVNQVREYCSERKNNVDPQTFVDFYESKGWKVGNQSMKDWKAAVRTWEKREKKEKKEPGFNTFDQRKYDFDDLERRLLGG